MIPCIGVTHDAAPVPLGGFSNGGACFPDPVGFAIVSRIVEIGFGTRAVGSMFEVAMVAHLVDPDTLETIRVLALPEQPSSAQCASHRRQGEGIAGLPGSARQ